MKSYGVIPRKKVAPVLGKYFETAASEENIKLKGFHFSTGAHLDSVPFHLRGFNAIDITSRGAAHFTHNKIDTPEKVDPYVLKEACILAQKVVQKMDKDYNILCY